MRPKPAPKGGPRKSRSFSKATCPCPAREGQFSPLIGFNPNEKAAGFQRLLLQRGERPSEPIRTAAVAVVIPAMVAIHAALDPAPPPALVLEPLVPAGQQGEAPLLAVIERLVERVGGIGDLLHRGCHRRHVVSAFAQARNGIIRGLL